MDILLFLILLSKTVLFSESLNLGSPNVSLLVAVLVAMYVFGIRAGRTITETSETITSAIKGISTVVMIIGAGGVFKQVIVDAGVGQHIAASVAGTSVSPLLLAFIITVIIRWATGQGAVSAITAAGIVAPLIPVLMLIRRCSCWPRLLAAIRLPCRMMPLFG